MNKSRETSIFTGCNIHQKRKINVSDAVPVHAVQVSDVNNCNVTFQMMKHRAERGIGNDTCTFTMISFC